MKKTIGFVMCISLLLTAFGLMPLQTSAAEPLTAISGLSYEFNTNGNLQGWSINQKITDLTVANGAMKGNYNITTGTYKDPRIQSPADLKLDPQYNLLKIRLKNTSIATNGVFYITRTSDGTGILDGGARSFSYPINANSDFTEYTIDLSAWDKWTSEVYRVWFDPASAFTGTFEFDYIRFYKKGSNVITYNANAGSDTVTGLPATDSLAATGNGYMLSSQIPVRAGHVFLGWSTTQNGSSMVNSIDVTGNTTIYAIWNDSNASYSPEGSYNTVTGKYAVKLYYTSSKPTNLASFGFSANTQKMTFDSITYESGIESAGQAGIGVSKNENGIIVDQWYPTAGYIAACDKKLIATLNYTMTQAQYNSFVAASDFTAYTYSASPVESLWSGIKYLFAPHEPSLSVNYEMININSLVDSSVLITINMDSAKATTSIVSGSKISATSDYLFSITPSAGEVIYSVTYKTGAAGTPVVISATNGFYTVPKTALTDNITIDVVFKSAVSAIAVTGLTAPVAGAAITTTATVGNASYALAAQDAVTWWNGSTQVTGSFGYNKAYTAKVKLTAVGANKFTAATTATINQSLSATVTVESNDSAYITYTFPATAKQTISSVSISGIDAPVKGAVPDQLGVTGSGYTATIVSWTPTVTTVFAPLTAYTVTAILLPDTDYEFAATITSATVNGNSATAIKNANGTVTVSYTFPATERSYIVGDVNDDGAINMLDATRLLKYLGGQQVTITLGACDADGSGVVDMLDMTRLLKYLAGWSVTLG